jgi:hypothetical protein
MRWRRSVARFKLTQWMIMQLAASRCWDLESPKAKACCHQKPILAQALEAFTLDDPI